MTATTHSSNSIQSNLQPLTAQQHGNLRWNAPTNYDFAKHEALCPLVLNELTPAALGMPLGFVAQGEQLVLVGIMGLKNGSNLFVTPDGRWIGRHIPSALRNHPFRLANLQDGRQVLCIQSGSACISQNVGTPLFNDKQPAAETLKVLQTLQQLDNSRRQTEAACALLQRHQLIQPWPIRIQGSDGEQELNGLLRIDETALHNLPGADLEVLQRHGALKLAYCQLLSMQNLHALGQLAALHVKAQEQAQQVPVTQGKDLDLEFLNQGGTLRFGA